MPTTDPTTTLTIGQLARRAGVGVETLRFYEREGLIAEPARRRSGYRSYPESAVRRVRFIRQAKELGFSLREIGALLSLRVDRGVSCADVRGLAERKIEDIDRRIASLQEMRAALLGLAGQCRGNGPRGECPILSELEEPRHASR